MADVLVIHYHEISLKGRNRDFFEDTLGRNLKRALRGTGYDRIRRGFGRITVDFKAANRLADAVERASKVFGIANIGVGRRVAQDIHEIGAVALELMEAEPFESFAVRARRSHSTFAMKSSEINEIIGQRIKDATGAPVRLKEPDATVHIEVFGNTALVYRRRIRGLGGLPVGTSGRMIALLSGGIDSPVASWRMALRGAEIEFLHFHGRPYTDPSSIRQVEELLDVLVQYQLRGLLHLVPLGDAQKEIVLHSPANLRVVLYRRTMMRIAAALATQREAQALITGDSLGQVASQTVENINTVSGSIPGVQVFRPLIGMDKMEIIKTAQAIGTFDISTRKYQDCCVLFEPRSPITRATATAADRAEDELDVDALAGKALAGIETRVFELPSLK
ncbi:MAG: tRNA 4-thiouridine(8) synthase ThiI [Actinobacteria bacterium]|nr:tRNA 4-thiouridine(8) synthase ThiI [Actinomycetota bacterium]